MRVLLEYITAATPVFPSYIPSLSPRPGKENKKNKTTKKKNSRKVKCTAVTYFTGPQITEPPNARYPCFVQQEPPPSCLFQLTHKKNIPRIYLNVICGSHGLKQLNTRLFVYAFFGGTPEQKLPFFFFSTLLVHRTIKRDARNKKQKETRRWSYIFFPTRQSARNSPPPAPLALALFILLLYKLPASRGFPVSGEKQE